MARGMRLKLFRRILQCSCSRWSCWINWRMWLTVTVVVLYIVVLLIVLPLMIAALYAINAGASFSAWFIAGIFTLLTIPIFLANLLQHLYNYTQPHLQAYIVRILWIVPVYSIDSWLGLKFPDTAIYWSTVRECYESYALYNFLVYLLNFLESEYDIGHVMETRPPTKHLIPFCCCKPWPSGRRFIKWCKVAVLQYAVIRPILTVIALITQLAGVYEEGHLLPDKSFVYIAVVNGITQGLALYSLVYFYKGTRDLLKPLHPVLKFAAIKSIIFFTFWQSLVISILVKANVIKQSEAWEVHGFKDVAVSIQDFVICVEMLAAAVGFYFIFSHRPYVDRAAAQVPCIDSFFKMVDVRDIYGDVKENFVDPIPVPRLPGRRGRGAEIKTGEEGGKEVEKIPLLSETKREEGGEEEEERGTRLGNGEDSLMVLSVSEIRHSDRGERELVTIQDDDDQTGVDDNVMYSHSSSDDLQQVRERKVTSD